MIYKKSTKEQQLQIASTLKNNYYNLETSSSG